MASPCQCVVLISSMHWVVREQVHVLHEDECRVMQKKWDEALTSSYQRSKKERLLTTVW